MAVELYTHSLFSDANLVSYWRLNGDSTDAKGSNDGSDTGITYNAANGKFVQGAGLNGSTSKIVIADDATLKPAGNFSVGGWFKTSTEGATQNIIQSNSVNTNFAGWYLLVNTSNKVEFLSGKNSGTTPDTDFKQIASLGTVTDGIWHLAVATYDGAKVNLYIDNLAVVSGNWTNAASYAATNYVRVGCSNNTGSDTNFYTGAIDDLFLLSRALSATEIANFYAFSASSAFFFAGL